MYYVTLSSLSLTITTVIDMSLPPHVLSQYDPQEVVNYSESRLRTILNVWLASNKEKNEWMAESIAGEIVCFSGTLRTIFHADSKVFPFNVDWICCSIWDAD
jgi:hypothetical protein